MRLLNLRLIICFWICTLSNISDNIFAQRFDIPVTFQDKDLLYPFLGGVNAPQFFLADVTRISDGLELVYHDRSGGISKIFSYTITGTDIELRWLDTITVDIPNAPWIEFVDYNLDGQIDIFAHTNSGIQGIDVYRGASAGENLDFTYIRQSADPFGVISYANEGGQRFPVYVADVDFPVITDTDGDGDIDVLSFEPEGTYIYWYKNMSVERGLPLDSLEYVLADRCWGKFAESFENNNVELSSSADECALNSTNQRNGIHAGSSISGYDFDLDQDLDIVLGDIGAKNLVFLPNSGTSEMAFVDTFSVNFPPSNEPVEIDIFPQAYYLEFSPDSIHIVSCPNDEDAIPESQEIWRYEANIPSARQFKLAEKKWFVSDMLDFGIDAFPFITDINNDGNNDLIVTSRFHDNHSLDLISKTFVFQQHESKLVSFTSSPFEGLEILLNGPNAMVLAMADLNADDYSDLVIGLQNGRLAYVQGLENGQFDFNNLIENAWDIDVGSTAHPTFLDANNDGLIDLLIGERNGNLNLYTNTGSAESPLFGIVIDDFWLRIDARQSQSVVGLAAPFYFSKGLNEFIILGTEIGNLITYELIRDNTGSISEALENDVLKVNDLQVGKRSKPFLGDIDNNGFYELWLGNARGGIEVFETELKVDIVTHIKTIHTELDLNIFPNPAGDYLHIQSLDNISEITIFDLRGNTMAIENKLTTIVPIQISHLPAGTYWLKVRNYNSEKIVPFIKSN